jgi:hypothetical protein
MPSTISTHVDLRDSDTRSDRRLEYFTLDWNPLKQLLVSVRVSHDDFSNTRTPQNRDSHESAEVRCVQFLFEPEAIRLNGFERNL